MSPYVLQVEFMTHRIDIAETWMFYFCIDLIKCTYLTTYWNGNRHWMNIKIDFNSSKVVRSNWHRYVLQPTSWLLVWDGSAIYYIRLLKFYERSCWSYVLENDTTFKKLLASSKYWNDINAARLPEVWIIK